MENTTSTTPPAKKPSWIKRGPVRWEAIIPVTIIVILIGIYFKLFFDANLKSLGQWGLSKVNKAEVNIGYLKTSFLDLSLDLQNLEFTNRVTPEKNLFQIGQIKFNVSWDALLRAKIFIEEAVVEGIKYGQPRKSPGFVIPEDPEEEKGPSLFASESEKLKNKALNKLESDYQDNVFGDIAQMLQGSSSEEQLGQLQNQIIAKQMIANFQKDIDQKKAAWDARLKSLPQKEYFDDVSKRASQIKTSNFANPQEAVQNIQAADKLIKEVDAKLKEIQKTGSDAQGDLAALDKGLKDIDKQVKTDIADLEKHFKIPQINAKAFVMSLVSGYITPYKAELNKYYQMAYKYVPPNVMAKAKGQKDDEVKIQPRERSEGKSYEFGRQNSYPLLWVRKISVSSDLGKDPQNGNLSGRIDDLTTSQTVTGKPTVATFKGDFPAQQVMGFMTQLTLDNRTPQTLINLLAEVKSYPIAEKALVNSKDVNLTLAKALGALKAEAKFIDFRDIEFKVNSAFSQPQTVVKSDNQLMQDILTNIFNSIQNINAEVRGWGKLPAVNLAVESNLGRALEDGFKKELNARIAALRAKIEAEVNATIAREKKNIEDQVAKLKAQVEGEVKKAEAQAQKEIKANEEKINVAKKDGENKLKNEGQKTLDDLKKKLGF